MQTVGTYLKTNREAKNISLSDISHHTKISQWYLDCLEKDDFKNIPGGPYIKSYISSYATFIGIDEDDILKRYDSSSQESRLTNQGTDQNPKAKKKLSFLAFLLNKKMVLILSPILLILLTAGYYILFLRSQKKIIIDESFKRPVQNELQSNEKKSARATSKRMKLEKSDYRSQRAAAMKNSIPETHPYPVNNDSNDANPAITKNITESATPKAASPVLNPDSAGQGGQTQSHVGDVIKVIKAIACGGVQSKNPVDTGESFKWSREKIYIWSMMECQSPPSAIKHIYYFKGQKVSEILLEIKSQHWRTWSYKTLSDRRYIGPWRVDITSVGGKLLKTIQFNVN